MDDRPLRPDPNAMTQPIPVVPVPPPRRPASAPRPNVPPAAAYAHRFGPLPWYLFARFAAFALDFGALTFAFATFGFHAAERGFVLLAGRDATGFATLAAASLASAIAFAFVCEALFGTTLGKLVFALHVRRRNGRRAGGGSVLVRALMRPIDLLAIGPMLVLVTPRRQRLGDLLGGTVVSASPIGAFAPLLGLALAGGIAYAQIAFGGGLTSAIGVAAETADNAPALYAAATRALGIAPLPAKPASIPTAAATSPATGAPETPAPTASSGTTNV